MSWSEVDFNGIAPQRKQVATRGARGFVAKATGGLVKPQPSQAELYLLEAERVVRETPLGGQRRIAVMAEKGGVGKTTVSALLAMRLATLRPSDQVLAIDANPDAGTLALRAGTPNGRSVRDVLAHEREIGRVADFAQWCSIGPSGLMVLASSEDPQQAEEFSAGDYRRLCEVAERYYPVLVTDCGTGIRHDALRGVLSIATDLVIVLQPRIDAAASAARTLATLQQQGHGRLAAGAVAVISAGSGKSPIEPEKIMERLPISRWVQLSFDEHLDIGQKIDPSQLREATRDTFTVLAAHIISNFKGGPQ